MQTPSMPAASGLILKTHIPTYHWQLLQKKGRRGLFEDNKVYINIAPVTVSKSKAKSTFGKLIPIVTPSLNFTVYFGKDVGAALSITSEDYVEVFLDKQNPNLLRLKKLDSREFGQGYKVNCNSLSTTLAVRFVVPDMIRIKPLTSTEIDFELYIDQSMIIDISSFVTQERRL